MLENRPMLTAPGETALKALRARALELRVDSLRATTEAGSGHPTSCLSAADIVAALFFHGFVADISNPTDISNDRFILSKGHAAPLLYSLYKQLGVVSDEQLLSLRKFGSSLEGHPTPNFPHALAATGSLGQGLSVGVGIALALKFCNVAGPPMVWVLMGDGECAEGSVWEAAALASHHKLSNLCAIVDVNRLGQSAPTMHGHDVFALSEKFVAFGWCPVVVDGLDIKQMICGICKARSGVACGADIPKPTVIIARTIKGAPIAEVCDKLGWHGKAFPRDRLSHVIDELQTRSAEASAVTLSPEFKMPHPRVRVPRPVHGLIEIQPPPPLPLGKLAMLRQSYAEGVLAVANASPLVVGLDGDVANSTFFELLENTSSGSRLLQCFIAEQSMVGVAVGLHACGLIPFVSTFGCFFTRAFDQLRMAAIGHVALRCSGTHCGVSTGSDGPSQMGLEDVALFRSLPDSVVLCPADGTAAFRMAEIAANNDASITYVRLPRPGLPTIYGPEERFSIGGCKILREASGGGEERACIVASGVCVHEALKAHELLLQQSGVLTSVIDAYSIKPIDAGTLRKKAPRTVIVVEDHYEAGGVGDAVCAEVSSWPDPPRVLKLAVRELPRSGSPEELRAWAKIDAAAIAASIHGISTPEY